jgi:hypothetical protein
MNILDWRLRRVLRKHDLPDLPEVRRMLRLAFWNGFTSGALEHRASRARGEALKAIRDAELALFADDAREWADLTMAAGLENWPDWPADE